MLTKLMAAVCSAVLFMAPVSASEPTGNDKAPVTQKASSDAAQKASNTKCPHCADKAAAERIAAEAAARKARAENKRVRLSVDVGTSLLWIQNVDDSPRSPSLVSAGTAR